MEDNIKMEKSYSVGRIKMAQGTTAIVSFMLTEW
jgi:hypothetical protein